MPIREDEVASGAPRTISADRLCPRCHYNWRGLREGGQCPECGMIIKIGSASRKHDTIANCSLGYLRTLNIGMLLIATGVLVNTLVPVLALAGIYNSTVEIVWGLAGLALPVGGWLITTPRRSMVVPLATTRLDGRVLRVITRVALVVSTVFAALWMASILLGGTGTNATTSALPNVMSRMLSLSEQTAIVLLMLVMMWLAEFAGDEENGGRFRFCAWVFGLGLLFDVLSLPSIWVGGLFRFLGLVIWVIELIAFFLFAFATFSLWNATNWAISNWHAHRQAEQRARDKFNEQRRQARIATPAPGFEPLPVDLKHATATQPSPEPSADVAIDGPDDDREIYGFADESDGNR